MNWETRLAGLSDGELGLIVGLHEAAEGRLRPFTFLDPSANLLSRSEDLTADVWQVGPMLQTTAGIADPWGTLRATGLVNTAQTEQEIVQTLAAPGGYCYCFSVFARSDLPTSVRLIQRAGGASIEETASLSAKWERYSCSGTTGGATESVDFALQLPSGAQIDVTGFQVEAQPGLTAYKKTTGSSGIYPNARFADDTLEITSQGPGQHSVLIRIVSTTEA